MLGLTLSALKWLAIPISLLLFLKWPLRDYFQVYSREANDLGQWLFALYVAGALTAATRAGTHLAVDTLAKRYPLWLRRRLARVCDLVALGPWPADDRLLHRPLGNDFPIPATPAISSSRYRFGSWPVPLSPASPSGCCALGPGTRSDGHLRSWPDRHGRLGVDPDGLARVCRPHLGRGDRGGRRRLAWGACRCPCSGPCPGASSICSRAICCRPYLSMS